MSEEYIMKRTLLCCLGLLALLFSFANAEEESGLKIYFLDVGQADATVILCEGESLMIDGGNAADSSFVYSFLTNTLHLEHLNYMIASHPHEDHVGGLAGALNACTVDTLYTPMTAGGSYHCAQTWGQLHSGIGKGRDPRAVARL